MTVSHWSPRQVARRALIRCAPRDRLFESLPTTRCVYLTFDDGPHPEYTPRLLDVLATNQSRATFFVVGEQCERFPELLRRIACEGHAIGNHTYSHLNAREVSPSEYLRETLRTNQIIQAITGRTTRLFRPPHGALNLRTLLRLWQSGQTIVLWNVDPKDYCSDETQLREWFQLHPIVSGDIVLLHDTWPHTPRVVADNLLHYHSECLAGFEVAS